MNQENITGIPVGGTNYLNMVGSPSESEKPYDILFLSGNELASVLFPQYRCDPSSQKSLSKCQKKYLQQYQQILHELDNTVRQGAQYDGRLDITEGVSCLLLAKLFPAVLRIQQPELALPRYVVCKLHTGEQLGGLIGLRIKQADKGDDYYHHHNLTIAGVVDTRKGYRPAALIIYCHAEEPDDWPDTSRKKEPIRLAPKLTPNPGLIRI